MDNATVVATSVADVTDGTLTNAILTDETGADQGSSTAWTNTESDRIKLSGSPCGNWTSNYWQHKSRAGKSDQPGFEMRPK